MRAKRKFVILLTALFLVFGITAMLRPPKSDIATQLADGSLLTFEGVAIGTNVFYQSSKFSVWLRENIPSKLTRYIGPLPPPRWVLPNGQQYPLAVGFTWRLVTNTPPANIYYNWEFRLDDDSRAGDAILFSPTPNPQVFTVTVFYESSHQLDDFIRVEFEATRAGSNYYRTGSIGKLRVRNPVPVEFRKSPTPIQ